MRCRNPVSRLNKVLFPEFGVPTTAMLASRCPLIGIWLAGMRVSLSLVTGPDGRNREMSRLLPTQRYATTEQPEFKRVAAQCRTPELDFRAFDEA